MTSESKFSTVIYENVFLELKTTIQILRDCPTPGLDGALQLSPFTMLLMKAFHKNFNNFTTFLGLRENHGFVCHSLQSARPRLHPGFPGHVRLRSIWI